MRYSNKVILFALVAIMFVHVQAGPVAYGVCQSGCTGLVVACYGAAGAVFGTVLAAAAPPAVLSCNAAFGTCSASCATAFLLPTP